MERYPPITLYCIDITEPGNALFNDALNTL